MSGIWFSLVFVNQSFPLYSSSNFCLNKRIIRYFPAEIKKPNTYKENGKSLPAVMISNVRMLVTMAETFVRQLRLEHSLACYSVQIRRRYLSGTLCGPHVMTCNSPQSAAGNRGWLWRTRFETLTAVLSPRIWNHVDWSKVMPFRRSLLLKYSWLCYPKCR
jgi:hypothetical protein